MDGPHKGSKFISTKWMDPTQGIKIHIHKMDGPHEGPKFISTKWTNPT